MPSPTTTISPFRRVLRNAGWLLTGKGVGAVLSLVYLGLATRALGVDDFGEFMLVLSTAQAAAALIAFQSWQVVVRYGVPLLKAGDTPALGRLVRFCALLDLVAALVGCLAVAVALHFIGERMRWSAEQTREATLFCAVLLLSARSTAIGVLRLYDRYGVGAIAESVTPIARFVGALAVLASGASVRGFLIAWAVAEVLTAIVHWRAVTKVAPELLSSWTGTLAARHEHAGLWRFALFSNASATLSAAGKQMMVIVVGLVTGPAAAGAYRIAFQLSQALAQIAEMFSRGVLPEFARADRGETRDALQQLFRKSTRLTLAVGATICLLVPLAGEPALRLIGGSAYASAWPLVLVLSLAVAIDVAGVGFEPMLIGTGRAGTALRIRLVALVVLIGVASVLMPRIGVLGGALATLAASITAFAQLWPAAHRAVGAQNSSVSQ